jgi:hypothetical protein
VILNRHYNHTSTENRGNGATDVQQYRRYIDMNMVAPALEYAKTLHDSGFTFEEFAEAYPNLAGSEYGDQLKIALEALDLCAEIEAQNQALAEQVFTEERERQDLSDLTQGETIPMYYCNVMKNDGVYFVVSRYGQKKIETTDAQIALDYARDYDQAQSGAVDHTNVKQYSFDLVKPDGRTFSTAVQAHSFTSAVDFLKGTIAGHWAIVDWETK